MTAMLLLLVLPLGFIKKSRKHIIGTIAFLINLNISIPAATQEGEDTVEEVTTALEKQTLEEKDGAGDEGDEGAEPGAAKKKKKKKKKKGW
jgi:hypothetical protein